MSDVVALCAGFSDKASGFITDDQGLYTLDGLKVLTNNEIKSLCKVVRRPGRTVPKPNARDPGQPATMSNTGEQVLLRAELNLKLACYYLRFKDQTSRVVVSSKINLVNVRELRNHRDCEKSHKDVDALELSLQYWSHNIESIDEWLRGCLGLSKIPLAYVVRSEELMPAATPAGGYQSLQDELINCAPIRVGNAGNVAYTADYLADRSKVWELISDLTRDQECWSYVQPAQRTRDGRLAFLGLKNHYLGKKNINNMSSRAEAKLKDTSYSGEKRWWNSENYVKTHVDQHAILTGLVKNGYYGIGDRSKVRHLMYGIKTKVLDPVKTQIMASATLRNDFDACVNLYKDFI